MESGSVGQSIYIEAAPEVVYEVVSSPKHITEWYVDEADYELVAGSRGSFGFGAPQGHIEVPITVLEAVPGVRFRFRWMAPPAPAVPPVGTSLDETNSLVVTFELTRQGRGTQLTVTETGMRELGWEAAVLEHYYNDHSEGWATFLARLQAYVGELTTR